MELEKTILVVEDDPINRKIIRKILSPYFNVVEAENGLVGINLVKEKRETISAVVLDLVMPIMDGYEFLKQITSLGYSDLPIIVTTGSSGKEAENIVLDYGAWDYVLKPYNGPVLVKRLNNAIARSEIEAYKKLEYISSHDPLTGLLRDTVMFKETARLLENNQDKEFVFGRLDIDHFIDFFSSFGEEKGNDLIKFVAKNILDFASRKKYCVIGRMSNDTFCICCEANKDEDFSLYVEEFLLGKRIIF